MTALLAGLAGGSTARGWSNLRTHAPPTAPRLYRSLTRTSRHETPCQATGARPDRPALQFRQEKAGQWPPSCRSLKTTVLATLRSSRVGPRPQGSHPRADSQTQSTALASIKTTTVALGAEGHITQGRITLEDELSRSIKTRTTPSRYPDGLGRRSSRVIHEQSNSKCKDWVPRGIRIGP